MHDHDSDRDRDALLPGSSPHQALQKRLPGSPTRWLLLLILMAACLLLLAFALFQQRSLLVEQQQSLQRLESRLLVTSAEKQQDDLRAAEERARVAEAKLSAGGDAGMTLSKWESPLSPGLHFCRHNLFLDGGAMDALLAKRSVAEQEAADAITLKNVQQREAEYVSWFSTSYQRYREASKTGALALQGGMGEHTQYDLAAPRDKMWPCAIPPPPHPQDPQEGLSRFGNDGDGGKWLCHLPNLSRFAGARESAQQKRSHASASCTIFSIGSNNQFDFEEAMIESTPCHVHSFDCSSSPPPVPLKRHAFHKVCLGRSGQESVVYEEVNGARVADWNGAKDRSDQTNVHVFKTYAEIVKDAGDVPIDLLKMDIEGGELSAFEQLLVPSDPTLPFQISFEQHHFSPSPTFTDLVKVWDGLWRTGYRMIASEPNPNGGCCFEFTFLRVFC